MLLTMVHCQFVCIFLHSKSSILFVLPNLLIFSDLDDVLFVQNQMVRTKLDIYVFITVTVDTSGGELLVSDDIIRQLVSGSVLTR